MSDSKEINLKSDIKCVEGIGPKKTLLFNKLGIFNIGDSLKLYPSGYEDMRNPVNLCDVSDQKQCLIAVKVLRINIGTGTGRKRSLHLKCEDATGSIDIIFFNAAYLRYSFTVGKTYFFYGKIQLNKNGLCMFHPEHYTYSAEYCRIMPVYPLTGGLNQNDIRKLTRIASDLNNELTDVLPESVIKSEKLCSYPYALKNIHYPKDEAAYSSSKYRLCFDEFFDFYSALKLFESNQKKNGLIIRSGGADILLKQLPFKPTASQMQVIDEVLSDMHSHKNMNRLIQGDVGSGKTCIAMAAIAEAAIAGYQTLFLVPTEILARQHFENLKEIFKQTGINTALLTSSLSAKEKMKVLSQCASGDVQLVIGTHALISDKAKYHNVGLVITDEQHRFGVMQRAGLAQKGINPDILVMTATPIPRTLALMLYSEGDVSYIKGLPPGRKKIITLSFNENERKNAYRLLFEEIAKGHQSYIVAPFIEPSEAVNGRSASGLYTAFQKKHPEIQCALLHSGIPSEEKDVIMEKFKNNEISLLISTVVIEVGIDVPNATVMLVENSEHFGLAQLHQLRGRVGRGLNQSYALLCVQHGSETSELRVKALCSTDDGFIIAEKDLELRGPGEFFGNMQHGNIKFNLADPIKQKDIAEKALADVNAMYDDYSESADVKLYLAKLKEKIKIEENLTI